MHKQVRVMRIVRLFRGRYFYQMHKIVSAIGFSVLPLLNAFFILFLVTIVFAMLATHLFRSRSPFFASLESSLFTMFQVSGFGVRDLASLFTMFQGSRSRYVSMYVHMRMRVWCGRRWCLGTHGPR